MTTLQESTLRVAINNHYVTSERNNYGYYELYSSPEVFKEFIIDFFRELEKQAAIDALAKAERIEEKQSEILPIQSYTEEFERQTQLGARCGYFAAYLANFIDQMTPDQREIIAIQFDQNLFVTDKAMAERFRNANNTQTINN